MMMVVRVFSFSEAVLRKSPPTASPPSPRPASQPSLERSPLDYFGVYASVRATLLYTGHQVRRWLVVGGGWWRVVGVVVVAACRCKNLDQTSTRRSPCWWWVVVGGGGGCRKRVRPYHLALYVRTTWHWISWYGPSTTQRALQRQTDCAANGGGVCTCMWCVRVCACVGGFEAPFGECVDKCRPPRRLARWDFLASLRALCLVPALCLRALCLHCPCLSQETAAPAPFPHV